MDAMRQQLIELGRVVGDSEVFTTLLGWNVFIMLWVQLMGTSSLLLTFRKFEFGTLRMVVYILLGCAFGVFVGVAFTLCDHMMNGITFFCMGPLIFPVDLVLYNICHPEKKSKCTNNK